MGRKNFLKPLTAVVASLIASTAQTNANAADALSQLSEETPANPDMSSNEGRPDLDPLVLEPSSEKKLNLQGHYSHTSHASHRSHYSGYTP